MTSFIGLPIMYEERIVGDLYLTDKNGDQPFTRQDAGMLRTFAAHAAIAIENARLYQHVQDLAVLEERDRIGMDLHDGVIQSLYATGLTLENALEDLQEDPAEVPAQLQKVIDRLNQTIADIRSYIFNLRPGVLADTDLAGAVGSLLQQLKVNTLLNVQLVEESGACRGLSEEQIDALFHVAQESLTNVQKHAQAGSVKARLEQQDGTFRMTIADDGVGFDPARPGSGQGLHNMQERVEALGGRLEVQSADGKGTQLTVELPLAMEGGR
jgi:signal transduction histidine kinase